MKVVAEFLPPDALGRFQTWKIEHAEALAAIPDDEVRVDSGRASPGGTFVRVMVADRHSDAFR